MAEWNIYKAICGVMADVGVVKKKDSNDFDHYKYRGIDAVMNALHPAMVKNQIFVIPEVLEQTREDRVSRKGEPMIYSVAKVQYKFVADDGSFITAVVIGEAMDREDKSMNKAMSAAFKYACFQTFCIPTEELLDDNGADMVDSEQDSPEPAPTTEQQKQIPMASEKQINYISKLIGDSAEKAAYANSVNSDISTLTMAQATEIIGKLKAWK